MAYSQNPGDNGFCFPSTSVSNGPQSDFGFMASEQQDLPHPQILHPALAHDCKNSGQNHSSVVSARKKTDTERVKRPMNAFMVWSKEERKKISKTNPKLHNSKISQMLGELWKNLDRDKKESYKNKANELREQHKKDHPDYKYRPRRKRKAASKENAFADTAAPSRLPVTAFRLPPHPYMPTYKQQVNTRGMPPSHALFQSGSTPASFSHYNSAVSQFQPTSSSIPLGSSSSINAYGNQNSNFLGNPMQNPAFNFDQPLHYTMANQISSDESSSSPFQPQEMLNMPQSYDQQPMSSMQTPQLPPEDPNFMNCALFQQEQEISPVLPPHNQLSEVVPQAPSFFA